MRISESRVVPVCINQEVAPILERQGTQILISSLVCTKTCARQDCSLQTVVKALSALAEPAPASTHTPRS